MASVAQVKLSFAANLLNSIAIGTSQSGTVFKIAGSLIQSCFSSFWGIFCIDGRTRQHLQQSLLSNISAAVGIVSPNYKAALRWLSNLDERWLLIIDNADDPDVVLDDYMPKGNWGHVVVTTQNPELAMYGNVGPGFYEFQGMDRSAAENLLLTAAGQSKPWESTVAVLAGQISERLGHLALAIAQAASAIRTNLVKLHEYLEEHEKRRRKHRTVSTIRPPSPVGEHVTSSRYVLAKPSPRNSHAYMPNRQVSDQVVMKPRSTWFWNHCWSPTLRKLGMLCNCSI